MLKRIRKWQEHFKGWFLNRGDHPVLVVWFEDLKANMTNEVRRMLDFLKVPYSESELEKRLENSFEKFHRKQRDDFEHFTPELTLYMRLKILETIEVLKKAKFPDVARIKSYAPPSLPYRTPTT